VTELEHGVERHGRVDGFDEAEGLGVIVDDDGQRYPFHCIEIADGTRTIDDGAAVRFDVLAKLGRWEASNIRV
jgi:CspA family cold shock protein